MDGRSYDLALLSAGSALTVLEAVMRGARPTAHAMLRRSGHHASRDTGYGFCVFNNCAIVARAAQADHQVGRVAIVDIDAHHGNGTEADLLRRPDRAHDLHPAGPHVPGRTRLGRRGRRGGRGRGEPERQPPGGHRRRRLPRRAWTGSSSPPSTAFAPELVIVACGVDAEPLTTRSPSSRSRRLAFSGGGRPAARRGGAQRRRPARDGPGGRLQPPVRPVLLARPDRGDRPRRRAAGGSVRAVPFGSPCFRDHRWQRAAIDATLGRSLATASL